MSAQAATIRRGRLSLHEREQIEALAQRKLSAGQIAFRLNRHPATINFAMYYMGLKAPSKPKRTAYMRNGSEVRSFTPAEDAMILEMRAAGAVCRVIADACMARVGHRRTPQTVCMRIKMLANVEDFDQ